MRTNVLLLTVFAFLSFSISNAQSTAYYDITFTSTWNATQHTSIPSNAHWSRLVGATHKVENTYMEVGQLASTGIKKVAEQGINSDFMMEVQNSPNSNEWFNEPLDPYGAIGSVTLSNVEFTLEHNLITLVSMVAPSPDWFMAVNSLNLRNTTNTAWKGDFSIDVFTYDAGTDGGTTYAAINDPISPVAITKINGTPFLGNKIGTLNVVQRSLSTEDFTATNQEIKVFPNPVKDKKITITTSHNDSLEQVEIFDVIGKKIEVYQLEKSNQETLLLNTLKAGIYLLKISTTNGLTVTKKLLLK